MSIKITKKEEMKNIENFIQYYILEGDTDFKSSLIIFFPPHYIRKQNEKYKPVLFRILLVDSAWTTIVSNTRIESELIVHSHFIMGEGAKWKMYTSGQG